jgi:methyltransferase (TIGR00027 family)
MSSTLAAQNSASRTAYDCAAVRASVFASTGLCSFDYLAADVVSRGSASARARLGVALLRFGGKVLVRKLVAKTSPGSDVFMFARQCVPDDMIRDALLVDPKAQAVILGAGLDTSGLRIGAERRAAGLAPGRFFEVDLPAMQAEKRRLIAQLVRTRTSIDDNHIAYVPCSFGENELTTALLGAGFDTSQPTVWVWSGVIHYLPEAAVRATIAALKSLSVTDSRLFLDYVLLEAYERPDDYGFTPTRERFDAFGEVMSFGFRQGADHISEWLNAQGLQLVRVYTHLDMVELYERRTGQPAPSRGTPWSCLCIASFQTKSRPFPEAAPFSSGHYAPGA